MGEVVFAGHSKYEQPMCQYTLHQAILEKESHIRKIRGKEKE